MMIYPIPSTTISLRSSSSGGVQNRFAFRGAGEPAERVAGISSFQAIVQMKMTR